MRILFCLGGLNKGGAERVATNLCNYFIDNNNEVEILITRLDEIAYEVNPKIKIKSLQESKKQNIIKHNINIIKNMKKEVLSYKPDLIISFLKEPTGRILLLKKTCKKIREIPLIISVRADPNIVYKSLFNKTVVKLLYNKSDGYVFQTEEAKQFFNKKIQDKSIIIPNPVDEKFLIEPSKKRNTNIVTLGRLTQQKNHKLLIDAFELLHKDYPEYKLIIYGEGPLENTLKEYIKIKKLSQNIVLAGIIDDVIKNTYESKMFVLSSDFEGMPNSLMEAMSMGIPCISTKCDGGGAEFLIENGKNGILVEKNNIEQMYNAMKKIIEDEKLSKKISQEAHNRMKKISPKIINKQWIDYMKKIRG